MARLQLWFVYSNLHWILHNPFLAIKNRRHNSPSHQATHSNFYHPQRSWGKVIFSQASVILFTEGVLPQCMLLYHTPPTPTPRIRHTLQDQAHPPGPGRHPPGPGRQPTRTRQAPPRTRQVPPPPVQSILCGKVNERAVYILLECNLVPKFFHWIQWIQGQKYLSLQ